MDAALLSCFIREVFRDELRCSLCISHSFWKLVSNTSCSAIYHNEDNAIGIALTCYCLESSQKYLTNFWMCDLVYYWFTLASFYMLIFWNVCDYLQFGSNVNLFIRCRTIVRSTIVTLWLFGFVWQYNIRVHVFHKGNTTWSVPTYSDIQTLMYTDSSFYLLYFQLLISYTYYIDPLTTVRICLYI
jgi:hypothetical protein